MKYSNWIYSNILTIILLSLLSCDPGKFLILENESNQTISIVIYFSEQQSSENSHIPEIMSIDRKEIVLKPGESERITNYGIGSWTNEEVLMLRERINSITLKIGDRTEEFTKNEIENIISFKLNGNFNSQLTLKIKNNRS